MDILPGVPLPLALALLALLDGLSVGTLLIPVFLLLAPGRVRAGRMLIYLFTIAVFYLAVGVLFLLGLVNVVDLARGFLSSAPGLVVRLVAGAALLVAALLLAAGDASRKRARVAASGERAAASPTGNPAASLPPAEPARLVRWRDRLLSERSSAGVVMGVALAAGLIEVATMLPYILGMTMLADTDLAIPLRAAALAGYCLVMIAPALVLLALRIVAAPLVERPLQRLADWLARTASENTAWIVGIIGFLIARTAATELGLLDWLGRLGD